MRKRKVTVSLIVLWIFIAAAFVPLYVMLTGSLKPNMALYLIPPDLNPFTLTLENYSYVFTKLRLGLWYGNSLFSSLMITVITVAVSATAGYAFAKKEFVGKKLWFAVLLATMMLPRQILMVPNFLVAKNFHLVDTLMGVVLTSIAAPFGVFLCKQFMSTLPGELIEAAQLDGCSEAGVFTRVVLPLSVPVLGALSIFSFINGWNDFVWQNIMLSSSEKKTMPLAIASLAQEKIAFIGYQMAGAALSAVPMLVIFLCFQKYFIKGITVGAVKG